MADPILPKTAAEAMTQILAADFRPFTSHDWAAYAGCETADPRICERADGMTIIIDGAEVAFCFDNEEGEFFDAAFTLGK